MRESIFETLVGFGVLLVAAFFLWFGFARGNPGTGGTGTVELGVRLSSASGIEPGTDVKMAGVKIGIVRDVRGDYERTEAQVIMVLDDRIMPLGDGTSARVQADGLFGGSYIGIEPGEGFGPIEPCGPDEAIFGETGCGEILYGQGSLDLMTLIGSFVSGTAGGE